MVGYPLFDFVTTLNYVVSHVCYARGTLPKLRPASLPISSPAHISTKEYGLGGSSTLVVLLVYLNPTPSPSKPATGSYYQLATYGGVCVYSFAEDVVPRTYLSAVSEPFRAVNAFAQLGIRWTVSTTECPRRGSNPHAFYGTATPDDLLL